VFPQGEERAIAPPPGNGTVPEAFPAPSVKIRDFGKKYPNFQLILSLFVHHSQIMSRATWEGSGKSHVACRVLVDFPS
jgi:hypothetical protein